MSSNPKQSPKQTPITNFTCHHPHKSYPDTPSTTTSSIPDTPASATDNSVFVSPASTKKKYKCTPPGEGEDIIQDQQIRVMTLIRRLQDLKEIMAKTKNNNKDNKDKNVKQKCIPDDSTSHSSLNQSFDCSLMNSKTFDVQHLLLTDDTDSVKAIFNSSFEDDIQDKKEEKKEGTSNEEAAVFVDVSCAKTSARKHSSDGNEAAKGSDPKCARKSEKEGEKKKGTVAEEKEEEEEEEEEGRKEGKTVMMKMMMKGWEIKTRDLMVSASFVGLIDVSKRTLGLFVLPTSIVICVFAKRGRPIMMMPWNISKRPILGT
jgi:hypothetical protein